ncbi:hypothetical protein EC9_30980 [Rosistilla ulvae]|uniref:Methyltransferase FkbM domain-containing protein n=1 Tax=Rosistilla ulvae TaxID=1930277 RepID=A0A517M202_9BACT|nr:FkbM family methyltransferase [Rosistilla ulvae]QDS88903.1 hypothetical protein EC9_30980 [Rosistilla ulvae]
MKNFVKRALNASLAPMGLELTRIRRDASPPVPKHALPTCKERLAQAKSIGFVASDIIDAGAFTGGWTSEVSSIFPDARFLVIEPNPHTQQKIRDSIAGLCGRATLIPKAVADEPGTLAFNIWGDPSQATSASLQSHVRGDAGCQIDVDVVTIDSLIDKHGFAPQLIKLDLQGAEIRALHGCSEALKRTEMFVVEFGCLQAYIDRATPRELMNIFYDNNYCLYDIVDCHYRPYDNALTGGDFFFVKNSSPLKEHLDYS